MIEIFLLGGIVLLGLIPVQGSGQVPPDDLEVNRRLLDRWRSDADHYARLKRDWQAFVALPPEQQARLRQLDSDLHDQDSSSQAHLWGVLERYNTWLEGLPENDRREIAQAPDTAQKLRRIKEIREREWVSRLPRAVRERVQKTPEGEKRAGLIAQLRKQERDRRWEWLRVFQARDGLLGLRSRPRWLRDFPADIQTFVKKSLLPLLGEEEKRRLLVAEGRWPSFARVLVQLASRHPVRLPPGIRDSFGPTHPNQLPRELRDRLLGKRLEQANRTLLHQAEGKWPDYALAVVTLAREKKLAVPPSFFASCPCRPPEFSLAVQVFLEKELLPLLDPAEQEMLSELEGQWPEYPRAIMELARQQNLTVPGTQIPGPADFWERVRVALPEVPAPILRNFALVELTSEERSRLQLSHEDPASWERLKQEFFARHPKELQRNRLGEIPFRPSKPKSPDKQ